MFIGFIVRKTKSDCSTLIENVTEKFSIHNNCNNKTKRSVSVNLIHKTGRSMKSLIAIIKTIRFVEHKFVDSTNNNFTSIN